MVEYSNFSKSTRHVSSIVIYGAPVLLFFLLVAVLHVTNPLTVGPLLILCVFLLLYACILSLIIATVRLFRAVWGIFFQKSLLNGKKWRYIASVVALAPVLAVALNTLGQFGVLECIFVIIFTVLGCFYVARRVS